MSRDPVREIQRCYPQVYLACHADHIRAKSNPHHVSSHDASLLAHLDEETPVSAGKLAMHMGVGSSTLSAALERLESLGHLIREKSPRDRRIAEVYLTPKGAKAVAASSVLDAARIEEVLRELSPAERRRAVAGLQLLAEGASKYQRRAPRRKRW